MTQARALDVLAHTRSMNALLWFLSSNSTDTLAQALAKSLAS
ncbi:hypothetical protein thalar_00593 [Litoreibacter arenae DSM 19593]|uniref:Uncharacterized protein n=1 Tax=Litoreibacter arenae DSM 19593 TaxID=1123360 RepID=S9S4S1_9RHOB|nr:hypothetical protein thalar_00593 [Litoreibacter arenae DSM 19593]